MMAAHREKVVLDLDDRFTPNMKRMRRAVDSWSRILDQNANPLDRVEPDSEGPQVWPGDDA